MNNLETAPANVSVDLEQNKPAAVARPVRKLNSDAHCVTGRDHKVCQDYAIAGEVGGLSYAIVCDGCSSVPHSDVGARLVALAAQKTVLDYKELSDNFEKTAEIEITQNIILNLQRMLSVVPISPFSCAATCLIIVSNGTNHHIYMFGDGACVIKMNGFLRVHLVRYTDNAPCYLSHFMAKTTEELWKAEWGHQKKIVQTFDVTDTTVKMLANESTPADGVLVLPYWSDEFEFVGISSDGIGDFMQCLPGRLSIFIPAEAMARQIFGFKSYKGEFVTRRLLALSNTPPSEGGKFVHRDDLGVAAIHMT